MSEPIYNPHRVLGEEGIGSETIPIKDGQIIFDNLKKAILLDNPSQRFLLVSNYIADSEDLDISSKQDGYVLQWSEQLKKYIHRDIDLSTSDVRIDQYDFTEDFSTLVLSIKCPNESYITVNVDNTMILTSNYSLGADQKTINFISPISVREGGSHVEVTYFTKIGTFTDVYTKGEIDDMIGKIAQGLQDYLNGGTINELSSINS